MQTIVGTLLICKCNKCDFEWSARNKKAPTTCANPDCRSTIWDKKVYKYECLRCKYNWSSTIEAPGVCPVCKSANWDSTKESHEIRNEGDYHGKTGRPRKK